MVLQILIIGTIVFAAISAMFIRLWLTATEIFWFRRKPRYRSIDERTNLCVTNKRY